VVGGLRMVCLAHIMNIMVSLLSNITYEMEYIEQRQPLRATHRPLRTQTKP